MSKHIEIERKFLVDYPLFLEMEKNNIKKSNKVVQGYINIDDEDEIGQVRVSVLSDGTGRITIKSKKDGITRDEYKYDIPYDEAKELVEKTSNRIYRENKLLDYEGREWLVQVYHDENEGLVLAECEIPTEDTDIKIPIWCLEEVSDEPLYSVKNLAKFPYSKMKR